jgi:hypothetical protein
MTSTPTACRLQGEEAMPLEEPVLRRTMDPVQYTAPTDHRVQRPCSRWRIDYDKFAIYYDA